MQKVLLIVLLSLVLNACQKPVSKLEFEEIAQSIINDQMLAGFSVSVFDQDSIYYAKGFGKSDLEKGLDYSGDTRQIIASISKTVIALSVMKAQELGILKLDDDINTHLPFKVINPYFPDKNITIRQLSSHTSSIKYSELISGDYAFSKPEVPLKDFCEKYLSLNGDWYQKDNFHNVPPGAQYDYSNIASALLAYLIEYKAGIPFKEFTQRHLFSPMSLDNTSWFNDTLAIKSTAKLYELNSSTNQFDALTSQKIGIYPVRDLTTNVGDLSKIGQMVLNNGRYEGKEILSEASIHQMLHFDPLKKTEGTEYLGQGIFWFRDKNQLGVPAKVFGHSGGDDGIFTMLWINENTQVGYILLANTGRSEQNIGAMIYLWRALNKYGRSIKNSN